MVTRGHQVHHTADDQALIMVVLAAQFMIGMMAQLMIDAGVLIMDDLEAPSMVDSAGRQSLDISRLSNLVMLH